MDFVNRLKTFMNEQSITSTQFADTCKIPRPSMSQILGGRNKKISDEVIGKIHEAYPTLSILWLLFGEGTMLVTPNIKTSEPQNSGFINFSEPQNAISETIAPMDGIENSDFIFGPEKSTEPSLFDLAESDQRAGTEITIDPHPTDEKPIPGKTVTIAADAEKSIVNIMVLYSDNSFQTFVPAH